MLGVGVGVRVGVGMGLRVFNGRCFEQVIVILCPLGDLTHVMFVV